MKKPNNTKPTTSKPSFGFGDAMFTVKNLTSDYAQFDNPPSFEPKPAVNKNPISPQIKKPVTNSKPIVNAPKITTVQQKQETTLPKEVFKLPVGNQYKNTMKLLELNQIKVSDDAFELTTSKGASKWQYNVFCDGVPAQQIVPNPQISFNFNADDLKQGQLGNCYFIAAMASIAHHPSIFQQRIPNFKKYTCQQKSFTVTMFQSGKLIEIVVDNLFPNIYVQPVGNDISPMILQKAYAQTYGNFETINVGFAIDAMRDLTGSTTQELSLKDKIFLRSRVKQCFESKYGMVIASKLQNINPGISPRHSYNVLSYQLINNEIFLELRDPRGWTKADFSVPAKLNNTYEKGRFWINQKDLQANFQMISICRYFKNYSYFYKTFSLKELTNRSAALIMSPKVATKVFISMHQKHKKFYDENFSYNILRLLIAEVDINKQDFKVIKTLKTNYKAQQVCSIELDLQPKTYIIIAQIASNKTKDLFPNEMFTISAYSERKQIDFIQAVGNIEMKPFIINYMSQNKQQFEQYQKNGLQKCYGQLFGYICVYYNNRGQKQINQEIEYTVKNIQITQRKVQLLPKQSKLIMHPIYAEQYQCSMKANTLFK